MPVGYLWIGFKGQIEALNFWELLFCSLTESRNPISQGGTDMTVNYIESLSINIDGLLILIVLMILVFKFIHKNWSTYKISVTSTPSG